MAHNASPTAHGRREYEILGSDGQAPEQRHRVTVGGGIVTDRGSSARPRTASHAGTVFPADPRGGGPTVAPPTPVEAAQRPRTGSPNGRPAVVHVTHRALP
ncbi:hypothetical protein GCM10011583_20400 [Streptomyces camponoticapitis]|uniref:Uncharacterized protein n=1 Tax=Streptomyces camponoticapitis TaxID=1616125 RepID=A0ABQ2E6A2_9ACTN|nr:hypothetical protein GCM10011583_20400 [Streptomyces camponoticapitis]